MRARMRGMGVVGLASVMLAGCAIPPAMPLTAPSPRRLALTFTPRVTVPAFRYEARPTHDAVVAGRVLDDSTGLPVAQLAAAWLTERPDSSAADGWGHFELANIAPGRYTLVTWAAGYEPRVDALDVRPDGGTAIEVRLKRATNVQWVARALPARGSAVRVAAAGGAQQ